jgi:hypothetical protein
MTLFRAETKQRLEEVERVLRRLEEEDEDMAAR